MKTYLPPLVLLIVSILVIANIPFVSMGLVYFYSAISVIFIIAFTILHITGNASLLKPIKPQSLLNKLLKITLLFVFILSSHFITAILYGIAIIIVERLPQEDN